MTVQFTIPGQPQGKGRPRVGRVGAQARMFTPAKTVAYEGLIAHAAQVAMAGRSMLEGPVYVELELHCQVPASWPKRKPKSRPHGAISPYSGSAWPRRRRQPRARWVSFKGHL